MNTQVVSSWSDVKLRTAWNEFTADLLVPSDPGKPPMIKVPSTFVRFAPAGRTEPISIVAVPDRATGRTYLLRGGTFYVSQRSEMVGVSIPWSAVVVGGSVFDTPTDSASPFAFVDAFAQAFTPERLVVESARLTQIPLGGAAPAGFFEAGSIPVPASIVNATLDGQLLRLELRSHLGQLARFWINLENRRLVKTEPPREAGIND